MPSRPPDFGRLIWGDCFQAKMAVRQLYEISDAPPETQKSPMMGLFEQLSYGVSDCFQS